MVNNTYRSLKAEAKRQRIFFGRQKYSFCCSDNVPDDHKEKFDIVLGLGRTQYETYAFTPNSDTLGKPWQLENKLRASRLVHDAVTCRKENRNEPGWRYEFEHKVFERFKIEVACKICRKRLWRSEKEVDPKFSNSKTTSLKDRQERRALCKCNPSSRLNDCLDPGISDVFSSRFEERCVDDVSKDFTKRPDRMHGLQETKNMELLLQKEYAHERPGQVRHELVSDILNMTTNPDNGGTPLLFPFLIHEAKGEKGTNYFEDIEIQTALPIKRALDVQQKLQETPGNTMCIPGGPLVWFMANRGETWRVYGATVYHEDGRPNYLISHLWEGSITGHNEALQLILIVDFIVDWARDIYRPSILRQLKVLGCADTSRTMTFDLDPDIYSLRRDVNPWMEEHDSASSGMGDPEIIEITRHDFDQGSDQHWKQLLTPSGIVRNGRDIESRFRALYITRDNLGTLLQSFDKPSDEVRFMRDLLAIMKRRCVMLAGEEVLNAIEDTWTGNLRACLQKSPDGQKKVYARFRLSYFVDPSWDLVRELTVLAVNEDALDMLVKRSQSSSGFPPTRYCPWNCPEARILDLLQKVLRSRVHDDFMKCLRRLTFSLSYQHESTMSTTSGRRVSCYTANRMDFDPDQDKKSPEFLAQAMVQAIYDKHQVGRREPSEPFLRISYCNHLHSRTRNYAPKHDFTRSKKGWEMGLIYSSVPANIYLSEESKQVLCLYTLHQSNGTSTAQKPAAHEVADVLIQVLFDRRVFKTSRRGKAPLTSRNWQENQSTYSFWLDLGDQTLKMTHDELILSIITWIRELRPEVDRLPKAEAYMFDCDILPEAEVTIKKWMESLPADPDTTTAARDKEMQNAVLRCIAKRSTGKLLWSFDNPIRNPDYLSDLEEVAPGPSNFLDSTTTATGVTNSPRTTDTKM